MQFDQREISEKEVRELWNIEENHFNLFVSIAVDGVPVAQHRGAEYQSVRHDGRVASWSRYDH